MTSMEVTRQQTDRGHLPLADVYTLNEAYGQIRRNPVYFHEPPTAGGAVEKSDFLATDFFQTYR
ncbi:MAG: hypothetical protein P4L87_11000 [Formivibrio sp.]|nr:hypothetical protein [Formivibrio sp.]